MTLSFWVQKFNPKLKHCGLCLSKRINHKTDHRGRTKEFMKFVIIVIDVNFSSICQAKPCTRGLLLKHLKSEDIPIKSGHCSRIFAANPKPSK